MILPFKLIISLFTWIQLHYKTLFMKFEPVTLEGIFL